jgi:hypothetical protein
MTNISDYDKVWERIQHITGWKKQKDMAEFLGINSSAITNPKKRGVFPLEWAVKIAIEYEESVVYILTGRVPGNYVRKGNEGKTNGGVSHLEDPLIRDIKLWLREMTSDNPGWRAWFEIELLQKIPQFNEWRKKKLQGDSDKNAASG